MTAHDRDRTDFGGAGSGGAHSGNGGGGDREPDERLAAYLDGEMTERERARFEGELRVNQQLAAELAAYERTVLSVRSALQAPTRPVDLADRVMGAVTAGPQRPAAGSGAGGSGVGGSGYRWFTSIAAAAALLVVAILIHSLANELPLAPESASVAQDQAPAEDQAPVDFVERHRFETGELAPSATPRLQEIDAQAAGSKDPDAKKADAEKTGSADGNAAVLRLERGSWSKEPGAGAVEPQVAEPHIAEPHIAEPHIAGPRGNSGDSARAKSTAGGGVTAGDRVLPERGPADKVPGRRGAVRDGERPASKDEERSQGDVRLARKSVDELPTAARLQQAPPPPKAAKSKLSSANERTALADPAPTEAEVLHDTEQPTGLKANERQQEEREERKADASNRDGSNRDGSNRGGSTRDANKGVPVTREFSESRRARRGAVAPEAFEGGATAGSAKPEVAGKGGSTAPAKKAKPGSETAKSVVPKADEGRAESTRTGSDDFFLGAARERRRAFRVPLTQATLPYLQLTRVVAPLGVGGGVGGVRAPERVARGAKSNPKPAAPAGPKAGGPAGPVTGGPSTPGPSTPGPSTPGPAAPLVRYAAPESDTGSGAARSSSVRTVSTRGFVAEQIAGSSAAALDRIAEQPAKGRGRSSTSIRGGLAQLGERRFAGLELADVTHWFVAPSRDRGSATGKRGKAAPAEAAAEALAPGERVWLVSGDRATVGRLMRELSTIARSASYRLKNGEVRVPVTNRAVAVRLGLPMAGAEPDPELGSGTRGDGSRGLGQARGGGGAEKATPRPAPRSTTAAGTKPSSAAQDRTTLLLRFRTVTAK
ncbi:MAG: hypothetical protein NXI31_18800 [bacterium]|nr:hypothetical protein [bacterium]